MVVARWLDSARTNALRMNPTKRLPESPRKIEAGLKLKTRKPNKLPARIVVAVATPGLLPRASVKMVTMENKAAPAANPSRPSIKLIALQISTTHRTVAIRQSTFVQEPAMCV